MIQDFDWNPPAADQLEVTLIGPGFGECVLIHLGSDHWLISDSCVDSNSGEPAALAYLKAIGITPKSVSLIIASHWHDDHIKGLAQLVSSCDRASFCAAGALGKEEFLATAKAYNGAHLGKVSSGVAEIYEVIGILSKRRRTVLRAAPNRALYTLQAKDAAHGHQARVWSLSPADERFETFLRAVASLLDEQTRFKRFPALMPNQLSVASWIEVGPISILLGGDLEETGDPNTGWQVIVRSTERPAGKAAVYKVAHHGAQNAHNDEVWKEMLLPSPFAILCPYNRGNHKRPSRSDVSRILDLTDKAFSSAPFQRRKRVTHPLDKATERTLREADITIEPAGEVPGIVRLRNLGARGFDTWSVSLAADACPLSQFFSV
ncbi:MAG: MBL fold metallo-hydrolase [Alphaproteobacteria bacterium]|nr:MBL fold metallo-hydrolase [Alphaproteobacteria bacterium]